MRTISLSATSIQAIKACPTRYKLKYVDKIKRSEDTESLRIGSNWHELHEVYQNILAEQDHETALAAGIDHLDTAYKKCPIFKAPHEWEVERTILLCSFIVYYYYYSDELLTYVANELPFKLPLAQIIQSTEGPKRFWLNPNEVIRVGKIDHIVERNGVIRPFERKSTIKDIAPGSEYWTRLSKDTQVNMYTLAFRDILRDPTLDPNLTSRLQEFQGRIAGNTLYDVWRRPTTTPKMLTQAATKTFLEEKTYYGETFTVEQEGERVLVNGKPADSKFGKKAVAIRETINMYAARLVYEMCQEPEKYFQRREEPRTQKEIDRFEEELYRIYRVIREFETQELWYENENSCKAGFTCEFLNICSGCGSMVAPTLEKLPLGYERMKSYATAPKRSTTEEPAPIKE